jgi:hypothetical protein
MLGEFALGVQTTLASRSKMIARELVVPWSRAMM